MGERGGGRRCDQKGGHSSSCVTSCLINKKAAMKAINVWCGIFVGVASVPTCTGGVNKTKRSSEQCFSLPRQQRTRKQDEHVQRAVLTDVCTYVHISTSRNNVSESM